MSAQKLKIEQLEKNYELVVTMMREAETERDELKARLEKTAAVQEQLQKQHTAEVEEMRAEHAAALAEAVDSAAELQERLATADETIAMAQAAQAAAEREVKRLEQDSAAASSRFEAAVAEAAEVADRGRRKVADELDSTRRNLTAEAAKAAKAAEASEACLVAALAEAETEVYIAEQRVEAAASRARDRSVAADKAVGEYKDEMRRSVGQERQRVAGMLYKEALQKTTLEEQERQIEELSAELADTQANLREAQEHFASSQRALHEKMAASATYDTQLLALHAAQAKKVSYIEELDERLAVEQATREEQAKLLATLQQTVTERTSKESSSAAKAAVSEKALATLKQEVRVLRVAVRSANLKKVPAACQTERVEGPQMASQTDFVALQMPLPRLAHGGVLVPRA